MLPARATKVTPVIRIDQSSAGVEVRPNNSLNKVGVATSAMALSPKTSEPARSTFLMLLIMNLKLALAWGKGVHPGQPVSLEP